MESIMLHPFSPFSIRLKNAIIEKKIVASFSLKLRNRLWRILNEFNMATRTTDRTGWNTDSDILSDLIDKLLMAYGVDYLEAYLDENEKRGAVDLEGFVKRCYPTQLLDVIELFFREIVDSDKNDFQREINQLMQIEQAPWLLCDGFIIKVDSDFLKQQVIVQTSELLEKAGFAGPREEFTEARNDLMAGDYKGAIHNARKALESTLKAIVRRDSGTPKILIDGLKMTGFYSALPPEVAAGFGDNVLMSLPYIRNRLGGHGQGGEIMEVPRSFAELAIHLAGTLMVFLIRRNSEITATDVEAPKTPQIEDDDLPF